jgi:hypothetical protein
MAHVGAIFAGALIALLAALPAAAGPKSPRAPAAAAVATAPSGASGSVLAWGCGGGNDSGQCTVPAGALSGVTAIAAGNYHSLALKSDGSVIAWGCNTGNYGECTVPAAALSGVTAIAAGDFQSLAITNTGAPTAVVLRAFSASPTRAGIRLRWRTASGAETLGFNVYREQRGKRVKLNRALIASGFAESSAANTYSFLDPSAQSGAIYTYRLQAVSRGGMRVWLGTVVARR